MKKLLFVDDDNDFLESNRLYFQKKQYEVFCADRPQEALRVLADLAVDCIVLDISMPGIDGFELCRHIPTISAAPIIFLSGFSDVGNRIASFRAGGDDFLAKPYDILELELRIEARIRKPEQVFYSQTMQFGGLCIDENRRVITYDGTPGDFSALQFDIVALLAANPGKVFSYEQLYDCVWKEPPQPAGGRCHGAAETVAAVRRQAVHPHGLAQGLLLRAGRRAEPGIKRNTPAFTMR